MPYTPKKKKVPIIWCLDENGTPDNKWPAQMWPVGSIRDTEPGSILTIKHGGRWCYAKVLERLADASSRPSLSADLPRQPVSADLPGTSGYQALVQKANNDDPDYIQNSDEESDVSSDLPDHHEPNTTISSSDSEENSMHLELEEDNLSDESDKELIAEETEGTPVKRTRRKVAQPHKWKSNKRKLQHQAGKAYKRRSGQIVPAKKPKTMANHKCRFNCLNKVIEDKRVQICKNYWDLANCKRQKDFLLSHVVENDVERRRSHENQTNSSRKHKSVSYWFEVNSSRIRVCKQFFLATLNVSKKAVYTAFAGKSETGTFAADDKRGKHPPKHKLKPETLQAVKDHIESFPTMESHYCRAESVRKYLDPKLSVAQMFDLYKSVCENQTVPAVKIATYRKIFCEQYNLSFFHPRKDQCEVCVKYKSLSGTDKEEFEEQYKEHIELKKEAQSAKEAHKSKAKQDDKFETITFDLQSVLQVPSADVSPMYYKRKVCVYNLTVYEGSTGNGHCFLWSEIDGKRGSSEIGTCLFNYLKGLPDTVEEVSLFSDCCGGQNRNQHIAALLLYAVKTLPIKVIEQNFLQSGHTQMECDSIHAAIEHEKKYTAVFTLLDWENIIKRAQRSKPYEVHRLHYNDFYDLQSLSKQMILNRKRTDSGGNLNWLKLKTLRFEKENSTKIMFRYNFHEEFDSLTVYTRTTAGRPTILPTSLKCAYIEHFPISKLKKADLLSLCDSRVIPEELHGYFKCLPVSADVHDLIPAPDCLDDGEDDD